MRMRSGRQGALRSFPLGRENLGPTPNGCLYSTWPHRPPATSVMDVLKSAAQHLGRTAVSAGGRQYT